VSFLKNKREGGASGAKEEYEGKGVKKRGAKKKKPKKTKLSLLFSRTKGVEDLATKVCVMKKTIGGERGGQKHRHPDLEYRGGAKRCKRKSALGSEGRPVYQGEIFIMFAVRNMLARPKECHVGAEVGGQRKTEGFRKRNTRTSTQ